MSPGLRVLHLFYEYLNLTENWTFRLIDNLPDTDVVVGSKSFKKCNFYSDKFEYLEFPFRKIEQNRRSFFVRLFNLAASQSLRLYPWYVSQLIGKVDLMHSHFSFVGWEYLKLARKLNIPHVISFYGCDYKNLPYTQPVWQRRYPALFREADLFLCEGSHGAGLLEEMGCPSGKIKVTKLGVDTRTIPFCERDKKQRELNLLQVATFVEKKGHDQTVLAFMRALPDCPNMTLTLVGGGPEGIRENMRQELRGTEAESKVNFVDRIEYNRLYEFMHNYHVFIHPSRHSAQMDCEGGAPVVLLDAQATGMPVISTTHCDIPEEVIHGKTGLLTPEKDTHALEQSIRRFYEMGNDEYLGFARAARLHIEAAYDSIQNAAQLAAVYRKLAESFNRVR